MKVAASSDTSAYLANSARQAKNPAYSPPRPGGGEPPRRLVVGAPAPPARPRAAAWLVLRRRFSRACRDVMPAEFDLRGGKFQPSWPRGIHNFCDLHKTHRHSSSQDRRRHGVIAAVVARAGARAGAGASSDGSRHGCGTERGVRRAAGRAPGGARPVRYADRGGSGEAPDGDRDAVPDPSVGTWPFVPSVRLARSLACTSLGQR